jgi:tetratricopeptide (TPR) repeat protein
MEPADGSWAVLKEIAADALELPAEERSAFLGRVCTDPGLRAEVDGLIGACVSATESGRFLVSPVIELLSAVTTSDENASGLTAALRDALAGSYTIERELGRGGMATVYLARDERHGRPVALKIVHPHMAVLDSTSADGSRFQREIRIAARLTHPHILPLHDSGAAAGLLFYTMPFVDGESLRDRIARESLPTPDTLRVLRDVARALAHAHRHGIVHRDVKPENILLNRDGDALVADFGVARALEAAAGETDESDVKLLGPASLLFGTPTYMAPEQADRASVTDHRADLYSLGVVAYEMLSGAPPFRQRSRADLVKAHQHEQPASLASLRPDLPPVLTALVTDLLAKRPTDRPADADAVVRTLDQAMASPGEAVRVSTPKALVARASRWRRTAWLGVVTLGALAAGFLISRVLGLGSPASMLAAGTLSQSDALLVADFDIRGGADSSLGSVIAEAVRTDLGQSKVVTIVPATRIRAVLERMQRPADAPLQSAVAREVAQREGIKAVVEGDLTPLRAGFVVTVRLVSAEGNELASFQETADQQNLIPVIGRLTGRLRGKIGESLKAIRASPSLQDVTTPSLAALRKYVEGSQALNYDRDYTRAARLLNEAVALDSTFASAWSMLAAAYRSGVMPRELANQADERAYRNRHRLPELERYSVEGSYFRTGPGHNRALAAEAYEAGIRVDSERFATSLGLLYMSRREYARAESLFRWYVARDSTHVMARSSLANVLYAQGKLGEAESLEVESRVRNPVAGPRSRAVYYLYNRGQPDSAQRALDFHVAEELASHRLQRLFLGRDFHALRGRLTESERSQKDAAEGNVVRGIPPDSTGINVWSAFVDVWHRDRPERGVRKLDAALASTPLASLPLVARSGSFSYYLWGELNYLWVARTYAQAHRPERARAVLAQFAADRRDTVLTRASAPAVHSVLGEIALAEGRPLEALEEFRRADRLPDGPVHFCDICHHADLGRAFDQAGMADSAIASFERYLETPHLIRITLDTRYAARILQRLGELYEAKGNRTKAIEYYERFVELWRNADPELQPRVVAVRRRIASLR